MNAKQRRKQRRHTIVRHDFNLLVRYEDGSEYLHLGRNDYLQPVKLSGPEFISSMYGFNYLERAALSLIPADVKLVPVVKI